MIYWIIIVFVGSFVGCWLFERAYNRRENARLIKAIETAYPVLMDDPPHWVSWHALVYEPSKCDICDKQFHKHDRVFIFPQQEGDIGFCEECVWETSAE